MVVTCVAVGAAGAAVFSAVVVAVPGFAARLVCEKVTFPPKPPSEIFCTLTVGIRLFENTQVKSAPGLTLAAGMVRTEPANVPMVPILPVVPEFASVQLAEVRR